MTMNLIIGNKLYSSWSLRPWLVLKAFGIPFSETVIPLGQADTPQRIKTHSPTGKVPLLDNGAVKVWESLAIIEYIADTFPQHAIWPKDTASRAHARAISSEMHAGFQPLRQACPMHLGKRFAFKDYPADVRASVARVETVWREARGMTKSGGPFLYGAFSGADAMYAPVVTRLDTYQWPVAPDTRAYMDAVMNHAAMRQWRSDALAEPSAWNLVNYETGHTATETFPRASA
jgi:glutathione S-transferase